MAKRETANEVKYGSSKRSTLLVDELVEHEADTLAIALGELADRGILRDMHATRSQA